MSDTGILIPIALVYMILALVFPVKKGGQPALPWLISICLQAGTVYMFGTIESAVAEAVPGLLEAMGSNLYFNAGEYRLIAVALCVTVNLLFILIINGLYVSSQKRRAAREEERMRAELGAERAEQAAKAEQLQKDIAAAAISINSSGGEDTKSGRRSRKERGAR